MIDIVSLNKVNALIGLDISVAPISIRNRALGAQMLHLLNQGGGTR
jgi:hypothetical protein